MKAGYCRVVGNRISVTEAQLTAHHLKKISTHKGW